MSRIFSIKKLVSICFMLSLVAIVSTVASCGKAIYKSGKYEGEGYGYTGPLKVSVQVSSSKITKIEVTEKADSDFTKNAIAKIINSILKQNNVEGVNTVTGATSTTKALIEAVTIALNKAYISDDRGGTTTAKKEMKDTVLNTDVVVIGSGGAGMSAALSAKENGANVIILEKMVYIGGNTSRAKGGLNAAGTKYQEEKGISDDVETFVKDTMTGGKNINDKDLVQFLAENAKGAIEWLKGLDIVLSSPVAGGGASYPRMHGPADGGDSGKYIAAGLEKQLKSKGIKVYTEINVEEIIMKDAKAVGVIASGPEGKMIVNAKAVIIATGGFSANEDLYMQYRADLKGFITTGHPGGTGDGIFMAEKVGAAVVDMKEIQTHPTVEQTKGEVISDTIRGRGAILLNQDGKRFGDEMATRDVLSSIILRQPKGYAYVVFGEDLRKGSAAVEGMIKLGIVTEGNTVEELAKKLGMPEKTPVESVAKWNLIAKNKKDTDFNRIQAIIPVLDNGPYYAIRVSPAVHHTMGGIKINRKAEVVSTEGKIIDGLYASGEVTGGVHGANRLGGNAVADIIVFGREAGANAAKYTKK